jgi:hypothetical protein
LQLLPLEGLFVDTFDIVEDERHRLLDVPRDRLFGFGDIEISQSVPLLHLGDTINLLIIRSLHKGVMDQPNEGLEEEVLLDCALMQEGHQCLQGE